MWALVMVIIPAVVGGTYYNFLWRKRLRELMSYLSQHHPGLYSQIKPTRILGLYPNGAFSASIRFAHDHEPLDDPVAEKLLADYAYYSDPIKAVLFMIVPILIVAALAAIIAFFYVAFFVIGKQ